MTLTNTLAVYGVLDVLASLALLGVLFARPDLAVSAFNRLSNYFRSRVLPVPVTVSSVPIDYVGDDLEDEDYDGYDEDDSEY